MDQKIEPTAERIRLESFLAGFVMAAILLIGEFGVFAILKWYKTQGIAFAQPRIWLDDMIPFVPELIWPYWLYFIIVYLATWLPRNRKEILQVGGTLLMFNLVAWTIYIVYPTQMIRPTIACETISCGFVGAMYTVDPGYAVMPSLHVANSIYAAFLFFMFRNPLRWFIGLFALSICAATLLVRQHYILDVPAGLLLIGTVGYGSWQWIARTWDQRYADPNAIHAAGRVADQVQTR